MKLFLNIFCWILAVFCIYFPCTYFNSDMNKKDFQVKHILVNTQEKASSIRNDILEKKITFDAAAKEYSLCESKENNGDLGYNTKGKLDKDFENAVLKLDTNVISEPVQTQAGWHLIKVVDVKHFSDAENFGKRY